VDTTVEVGGWEHECCGPSFERDSVVELTCVVIPGTGPTLARHVETHHGLETARQQATIRGRVVEIAIQHPDGSVDQLERLPSGRALRGFDEHDDGRLQRPSTGDPVVADSEHFLLRIAS
jgi:hypothetical protein